VDVVDRLVNRLRQVIGQKIKASAERYLFELWLIKSLKLISLDFNGHILFVLHLMWRILQGVTAISIKILCILIRDFCKLLMFKAMRVQFTQLFKLLLTTQHQAFELRLFRMNRLMFL
jgi:hypothetical protein